MIQDMPAMDFAISCSIDPGTSRGRTVIRNAGLKSLMADYHADNFYPAAGRLGRDGVRVVHPALGGAVRPRARGGLHRFHRLLELLHVRAGQSRADDGHVGMAQPSRRTEQSAALAAGRPAGSCLPLGLLAALRLAGGLAVARGGRLAGLDRGGPGKPGDPSARHAAAPACSARWCKWSIDRTLCDGPLSDAGFIEGKEDGFGIFERWILRLGYFTSRRDGRDPAYFQGDALVFLAPHRPLPRGFRDKLVDYVRGGGKLLVVDSPWTAHSRAGRPRCPTPGRRRVPPPTAPPRPTNCWNLSVWRWTVRPRKRQLDSRGKWPAVPIAQAAAVTGGEPWPGSTRKPARESQLRRGRLSARAR